MNCFQTEVQVLEMSTSDHMTLMLNLHRQVYVHKRIRFRFENMWLQDSKCKSIVQTCWKEEGNTDLPEKMVQYCAKLEEKGGGLVRDMTTKLARYKCDMKRLRTRRDAAGLCQYAEARWSYLRLLEKKEIFSTSELSNSGFGMVIKIRGSFISTHRLERSTVKLRN